MKRTIKGTRIRSELIAATITPRQPGVCHPIRPRSRSEFIAATLIPVHHAERDTRFGVIQGIMALAFVFGVIGLMRLVLAILGDGPHSH